MCDHKNSVLFSRNSLTYVTQVCRVKMQKTGTSLVVQWLRLSPSKAEGTGSVPGEGLRSRMRRGQKENRKCIYKPELMAINYLEREECQVNKTNIF